MKPSEMLARAIELKNGGKTEEARAVFGALMSQPPDTDSAEEAKAHLFNLSSPDSSQYAADEWDPDEIALPPAAERVVVATTQFIAGSVVSETLDIVTARMRFWDEYISRYRNLL